MEKEIGWFSGHLKASKGVMLILIKKSTLYLAFKLHFVYKPLTKMAGTRFWQERY